MALLAGAYTNFWQGAMAWSGWWHNQVGLLTEVASVRVAAPIEQQRAQRGAPPQPNAADGGRGRGGNAGGVLPPPTDVNPRTEYPRPWLGGRWTLRDIVDYELIATIGLLETAADRRETLLRQIYEVNRETVEAGRRGDPAAILIPVERQHDPRQAGHLVEKLQMAGVDVHRATSAFEADGIRYGAGTFVVPMAQVFARYARDILERQTYPEVRRAPNAPPEPPYDVSAWSLGMLMGVEHVIVKAPLPATVAMEKLGAAPAVAGKIEGSGTRFSFDYRGPDAAIAINRLLADGAAVSIDTGRDGGRPIGRVVVTGAPRGSLEKVAADLGFTLRSESQVRGGLAIKAPRIGMYNTWSGGNMDEGWTRWVLERYRVRLHHACTTSDIRTRRAAPAVRRDHPAGPDAANSMLDGLTANTIARKYRGGIGDAGWRRADAASSPTAVPDHARAPHPTCVIDEVPGRRCRDLKQRPTRESALRTRRDPARCKSIPAIRSAMAWPDDATAST